MIDRTARDRLAEALRALATGLISNDEFEGSRLECSKDDAAIQAIYFHGAWMLYSDFRKYKFVGKDKLGDETKSKVARWILFLKTDLPYEWEGSAAPMTPLACLASILTFGLSNHVFGVRFENQGDISVWPFIRKSDYETALHNPPYLRADC